MLNRIIIESHETEICAEFSVQLSLTTFGQQGKALIQATCGQFHRRTERSATIP